MVQVTLKTIKGENFQVEMNPTDKVSDLKAKVAQVRPDLPADVQKLIYTGKILVDDVTIEDSGYQASGFIVAMATKAKAPPAAAPAAAPAAETPAAAPTPAPAAATPTPAPAPTPAAAAPLDTAAVDSLCEMGFPREEVERALRAASGNTTVAVEFLMTGIPEPGQGPAVGPGAGGMAFPASAPRIGGAAEPLPEALEQLRSNPQFTQLAAMIAGNPQMLAQVLQSVQQTHPEIAQAIQEHPEAFMRLLQEATQGGAQEEAHRFPLNDMMQNPEMLQQMLPQILPEIEAQDPAAAAAIRENPQLLLQILASQGGMPGMPGMGAGGGGGGPEVIRLTEEENAAVERLAALGFDKEMAAQAYLACDKNEELAANFLFDNAGS